MSTADDVLSLYADTMKMQYFNDGNKRTALLFANMLLLSKE
jgi:prophage maintenance system killer protein